MGQGRPGDRGHKDFPSLCGIAPALPSAGCLGLAGEPSGDRIPGIRAFGYPLGAKDYNDTVTKENESKTDDAELAAAKDALDAAQKEVEKAQEAVDAATSIEERNALIEKLNEAVEKKKA